MFIIRSEFSKPLKFLNHTTIEGQVLFLGPAISNWILKFPHLQMLQEINLQHQLTITNISLHFICAYQIYLS